LYTRTVSSVRETTTTGSQESEVRSQKNRSQVLGGELKGGGTEREVARRSGLTDSRGWLLKSGTDGKNLHLSPDP